MSIYNVANFSYFIQASEDDKDEILVKYYAKTLVFSIFAYFKQRHRANQAGNKDVTRQFFIRIDTFCITLYYWIRSIKLSQP